MELLNHGQHVPTHLCSQHHSLDELVILESAESATDQLPVSGVAWLRGGKWTSCLGSKVFLSEPVRFHFRVE